MFFSKTCYIAGRYLNLSTYIDTKVDPMTDKEYILFCDESDKTGKYYSNFYGGLLVGSSQYERITNRLNEKKQHLNLFHEVKWERVTGQYLEKYKELIRVFFDEITHRNLRVRIMFHQNAHVALNLQKQQVEKEYFLLYYQFIKHAFGLEYSGQNIRLRLYFDQFPDTSEKSEQFKGYLLGLMKMKTWKSIRIAKEDITEVLSEDHVLIQCLDVVLGAMSFRLNDKHKIKPEGKKQRGKRTIAKEKLYKFILYEIRNIHPGFNIGINTRVNSTTERWEDPYLHWSFKPHNAYFLNEKTKKYQRKNPT